MTPDLFVLLCPSCRSVTTKTDTPLVRRCPKCGTFMAAGACVPQEAPGVVRPPNPTPEPETSPRGAGARESVSGVVVFAVEGRPVPQPRWGSKRDYKQAAVKVWRALVADAATSAFGLTGKALGPASVSISFRLARPKRPSHAYPRGCFDLDNGAKAVLDALNGIAWDDDSQVVSLIATKDYADSEGCDVRIVWGDAETARRGEE